MDIAEEYVYVFRYFHGDNFPFQYVCLSMESAKRMVEECLFMSGVSDEDGDFELEYDEINEAYHAYDCRNNYYEITKAKVIRELHYSQK